ncbi:MAG: hypothetical protein O3C63_08625 [Cyanobacteria bacterium]|nr:hypothetical protein [Cyanobacteriota bacterium]MDA1021316.1 hypothetical protein [Cyanobacteriota bacterium]
MMKQKRLLITIIIFIISSTSVNAEVYKTGVVESTPIPIVAEWPINNETQVGEHFSARITENIMGNGNEILIPKNSRVIGTVVRVDNAKLFNRDGKVDIQFQKIIFPDNVHNINISADGMMVKHKRSNLQVVGNAAGQTAGGAIMGAAVGFKFGGVLGTSGSTASNVAIGAITGAGLSLISFIGKKGQEVKINPGLPMTLNLIAMEEQEYKEQQLNVEQTYMVNGNITNYRNNKIAVEIENKMKHSIPLGNLKIVDGLGYTVQPNFAYGYHDEKSIPATSNGTYEFEFNPTTPNAKYWLVLTDSFGKQEYFRKEIK